MKTKNKISHELLDLMNVGKATYNDLQLLKINSVKDLARSDPDECKPPIIPLSPKKINFITLA